MRFIFGAFKALKKIAKHRYALLLAGIKLKVPWKRIIKHDNSKFHPVEFVQYVNRFELGINEPEKWGKAWEHHWRNNDHHIEYWEDKNLTFSWGKPEIWNDNGISGGVKKTNPNYKEVWIPDGAIREMIADWMAASYAYAGEWPKAPGWKWGDENLVKILLKMEETQQPETSTRFFAIQLLEKHGMISKKQLKYLWENG